MNWKYCQGQLWKCFALRFSRVVKELEKSLSGTAWEEVVLCWERAAGEFSLRALPDLIFVSFCRKQTRVSQSKSLCMNCDLSVNSEHQPSLQWVLKPVFAEAILDFQEGSICKCYQLEYLDVYSLGVEKSSTRCTAVPLLLADEERYICLHTHKHHPCTEMRVDPSRIRWNRALSHSKGRKLFIKA